MRTHPYWDDRLRQDRRCKDYDPNAYVPPPPRCDDDHHYPPCSLAPEEEGL